MFKPVHIVATHSEPIVDDTVAARSSVCINDVEAAVPCNVQKNSDRPYHEDIRHIKCV